MIRHLAITLLLATGAALTAADRLPTAPAGVAELHGTFQGERFWARLNVRDARYGNHRMLELVYTPPRPSALGGVQLVDCPFLLLDDRLGLVAWNGRDSLVRAVSTDRGYHVTRELERNTDDGKELTPDSDERDVAMARGWDERIAPVLLAFAWRAGSQGEVPVADLFGPSPVVSTATWKDGDVMIAGRPYHASPDTGGRLAGIADASGKPVLTIAAWITP